MGSLILCYKKKAKQPYEITRIHRKIYTIEELCYYLCNNLYLIDYTIMNEQLCDWLEEELSDGTCPEFKTILKTAWVCGAVCRDNSRLCFHLYNYRTSTDSKCVRTVEEPKRD